jgi:membrane fusion protein, multidrug efflux system
MGSRHRGVRAGLIAFSTGLLPGAAPAPLPPAVLVSPVEVRDVAPAYDFIGRVTPIQSVQIVPRITAFIEEEPVAQGADVKAGDVLFELQKTQYQAAVQSAQAQLDSANAGLRLAQLAYARAAQLNNQGVESQATLDQATATRDQN